MCGTNFWPEFGGFFLTPSLAPGIQTWSQPTCVARPQAGGSENPEEWNEPLSPENGIGDGLQRAVLPHLCWRGCRPTPPPRACIWGADCTCDGAPRGEDLSTETSFCARSRSYNDCSKESLLSLPWYPTIHSPHWGPWPASSGRKGLPVSLTGLGCSFTVPVSTAAYLPLPAPWGCGLMQ